MYVWREGGSVKMHAVLFDLGGGGLCAELSGSQTLLLVHSINKILCFNEAKQAILKMV